jgi:NAD-dependent deacetylase
MVGMERENIENIGKAAELIVKSKYAIAFTGAGISVESGIAPFRGRGGLYEKVSSRIFDLDYFYSNTKNCWYLLLKFILIPLLKAKPNEAHINLTKLEEIGFIKATITQNIDSLHEKAESRNVIKFHGSADRFKCIKCGKSYQFDQLFSDDLVEEIERQDPLKVIAEKGFIDSKDIEDLKIDFDFNIPKCEFCGSIIKPEIVFFKEPIPEEALNLSFYHAQNADCLLIIGTSGVVYPAAMIPQIVKKNKGKIIEINPEKSEYTYNITDIFIKSSASLGMIELEKSIMKFQGL